MITVSEQSEDKEYPRKPPEAFPPDRVPWLLADAAFVIAFYMVSIFFLSVLAASLVGAGSPWIYVVPLAGAPPATLVALAIVVQGRAGSRRAAPLLGLSLPGRRAIIKAVPLVLTGAAALYAVTTAQISITRSLGYSPDQIPRQRIVEAMQQDPGVEFLVIMVLLAVVVAPVAEELLFRGMLYLPLRSKTGPLVAGLIVATIFALIHGYLWGAPYLFVIGVLLAALVESTGGLTVPIIVHALHNAVIVVAVVRNIG